MESALRQAYRQLQRRAGAPGLAYQRVRQAIEQVLEQRALTAGDVLPSARALAALLDVSRVNVRRVRSFSRLAGFSDDLRARGLDPQSVFLERSTGQVTPDEAMALHLSPGTRVIRLVRVRHAGGRALAYERTVVPFDLLRDPDLVTNSLYDVLETLKLSPVRALPRLRAVAFGVQQAAALDVPVGSAGLFIERRAFLAAGRAVEFTHSWCRGDAYDFVAELHRD